MNELALFAGVGGGLLGGKLLGWRTVCAVELNQYAASVLCARQNDGILSPFPIWDDVCTFDGKPWRGIVDLISGGFPCQDISVAGKGAGIKGERSGLWKEFARIIGEVRPRYVFVENSPMLTVRGIDTVLGDLATLGYDAKWGILGAIHVGAPHRRERIWIVGNTNNYGFVATKKSKSTIEGSNNYSSWKEQTIKSTRPSKQHEELAYANSTHGKGNECTERIKKKPNKPVIVSWWDAEPDVGRVVDGVAARVDRLKAIGNGQVPSVVELAWKTLIGG